MNANEIVEKLQPIVGRYTEIHGFGGCVRAYTYADRDGKYQGQQCVTPAKVM
ncbi:MAG: hypothetical protein GVY30_06925 [Chloroflexi bacterium]|nr:hypothetical protein [Chloroflexota bacterium]